MPCVSLQRKDLKFQEEPSDLETQLLELGFLCENPDDVGTISASFAYNAHGSMTSMPHLSAMDWDFAEKLCHVTRGTTEAYYSYDGSGVRTRKVVEKSGVVETRLYLGGFEIWRKTVNGVLDTERETLHVMDDRKRIAIVETLTVENGNRVAGPAPVQRYQLDNHLGSASLELDASANVISYEEYYPYGDTSYRAGRSASEVSQKRYRYTGKEKDEESCLYYHGARYYACWLGRWTAVDPIGIGDGLNVYMYVQGNPVKLQDPNGTESEELRFKYDPYLTSDDVGNDHEVQENEPAKEENGTYLPGSETDFLTKNSTFEERQAFANRQGYKIVDPNPEDEWWYDDGEHCQWMLSEQGKLVPLQDDTPDSNNVLLDNTENVSDSGNESGTDFGSYANAAAKATQVGLDVGKKAFDNVVGDINKLGATALDNPSLSKEASEKVQQAFLDHSNAAKATAKFMNKANVALSIGLGAIEAAEYACQRKPVHVGLSVVMTAGSIIAGGIVLGSSALSLGGVIAASVGLAVAFSIVQFAAEKALDYMEIK